MKISIGTHFGAIYLRVQEHHSWEFLAYASEWLTYAGNDRWTLYLNDPAKNSMVRCVLGVEGLCGPKLPEVCRVKCRVASCPTLNMSFARKIRQNCSNKCYLFGFDYRSKWNMLLMGSKTRPKSKTTKNKYWTAYSQQFWMEVCLFWSWTFRNSFWFDVHSQWFWMEYCSTNSWHHF